MSVARLEREARLLQSRVRDFSPTRWRARSLDGRGTRADAVYRLIVTLAELGCRAGSGAPSYTPVERLGDHGLADQLAVLTADLLGCPGVAAVAPEALAAVLATRAAVDPTGSPNG